ncbi:MAG: alanine racemase [Desulfobacteraceae bacterium]|nr:alanine racemase [Desulfobacteraceae bacterium]
MSLQDVWAEVDLKSISHNIKQLKSLLSSSTRMMAVVKANAYGHGLLEVAGQAISAGADVLGVARIDEAIRIREAGLEEPILIFGYTPPEQAAQLIDYNLTQAFWSYQTASLLSDVALSMNQKIKAHLKVDTGMGRLGVVPCDLGLSSENTKISERAVKDVASIKGLPGIELEGIYTHFATADAEDKSFALHQFEIFNQFIAHLKKQGIEFKTRHAANSAATIDMPETHLDMVRTGISVYGYYPSDTVDLNKMNLLPAMTLKARIIHLKAVSSGCCVSYGATEKTSKPTKIATVSIGYADGYNRLLSSKGKMLVRNRLAPVIGRICMDQTMLDVGKIPDVAVGDEVVVFGPHKEFQIGADKIADKINTISYEVLTTISDRVLRVYRK